MANVSIPDTFDKQHDVPRPDGYLPIPDWKAPVASQMPIGSGLNGYTGQSPRAARSDHVHPCNISPFEPEKIGLPRWLNARYSTMIATSWYGIYGSTGTLDGTNRYSNMYSLSNHVHAYGFVGNTTSSTGGMNDKSYCTLPDGKELDFGLKYTSTNLGLGVYEGVATPLNDKPLGDSSWMALGFSGRLPFPAHADHSHPLNLIEIHSSGATGNNVKNYVKPIAFDKDKSASGYGASYGTQNWYARVDHVHALPTDGKSGEGIGTDLAATQGNQIAQNGTAEASKAIPWVSGKVQNTASAIANSYKNKDANKQTQTWNRDTATTGFKMSVMCGIRWTSSNQPLGVFRNITVDKYGLVREVSAVNTLVAL